jgi:hypothetical protein
LKKRWPLHSKIIELHRTHWDPVFKCHCLLKIISLMFSLSTITSQANTFHLGRLLHSHSFLKIRCACIPSNNNL